jgi:opacity protein-like surface antigen
MWATRRYRLRVRTSARLDSRRAIWLAATLVAACVGSSSAASAQLIEDDWEGEYSPPSPSSQSRQGIYVGIGGLYAMENFDRDAALNDPLTPLDIDGKDTGGPQLRLGYRFHPRFSGELLFQYYADFNLSTGTNSIDDDFGGWTLTANVKAYGLLGRIQPYGVLGLGALVFDEKQGSDSAFAMRLGGGLDLYLTDSIVFDVEIAYVLPTGSIDDLPFATFGAGIQYRY